MDMRDVHIGIQVPDLERVLNELGPGDDMAVHHVGFRVDDVAQAAARFSEAGPRPLGDPA